MDLITLGQKIRSAREIAALSQRDLADRIGLDQSAVSRLERGQQELRVSDLYAWAEACETTVKTILEA